MAFSGTPSIHCFRILVLVFLVSMPLSPAHGEVFDISFSGTVGGTNTPFGDGAIINVALRYDTADVQIFSDPGLLVEFVETTDASITIGGVAQTGVVANVLEHVREVFPLTIAAGAWGWFELFAWCSDK